MQARKKKRVFERATRCSPLYRSPKYPPQPPRRSDPRRDCEANGRKLSKAEELVIVERTLDQDLRGFPPTKLAVRAMADRLLVERGSKPTRKRWGDNLIK